MKLDIKKGVQKKPIKCVIYGHEGIGKSTLASKLPGCVFIDVEEGTSQLDVARLPTPKTWIEFLSELMEVAKSDLGIETLVIDTADAAERLCIEHVCAAAGKASIEDWGYGKGYALARDEYAKMISILSEITNKGINVCVLAHACISRVELPEESTSYDRWGLKLIDTKRTSNAALLKEWADLLLFIDYKVYIEHTDDGKGKAKGGKRVIKCTHSATYDAKNRYNLPDEIALDDAGAIIQLFDDASAQGKKRAEETRKKEIALNIDAYPARLRELKALMVKDSVSDKKLRKIAAQTGAYDETVKVEDYEKAFVATMISKWGSIVSKAHTKEPQTAAHNN